MKYKKKKHDSKLDLAYGRFLKKEIVYGLIENILRTPNMFKFY